ncbi:MAG: hypothetical protein IIA53_08625 [Chloroflexi bacterium]|nr:hypothetical protein [Chloroflexota bacterium]
MDWKPERVEVIEQRAMLGQAALGCGLLLLKRLDPVCEHHLARLKLPDTLLGNASLLLEHGDV